MYCMLSFFYSGSALAVSFQNLPRIAEARLGLIDSRTYTKYLETEKKYDRLLALLKQELNTINLAEMNLEMGVQLNDWDKETINKVFEEQNSADPMGDFFKLRQYDPIHKAYDPEGKLYLLDDIADVYTYRFVDFKKAARYNKKTREQFDRLEKIGLDRLPVSDYYNTRRCLYHTFIHRMAKKIPTDFSTFPGRIDLITPFPESYLQQARHLDFERVKQRIDDREQFIGAKLGEAPTTTPNAKVPAGGEHVGRLFGHLERFMVATNQYHPFERYYRLAEEAYRGYRNSGSTSYFNPIIGYGESALAAQKDRPSHALDAVNTVHLWLGLAYLKRDDHNNGIRHIEMFLGGIDRHEGEKKTIFREREALVAKVNREVTQKAKSQARWMKAFSFALMAAAATGIQQGWGVGANPTKPFFDTIGLGLQNVVDVNSGLRMLDEQSEVRKEVAKLISPYSLKIDRYLDKFEMVDYFLEVGKGFENLNMKEKALVQYEEAVRIIERQRTTILTERQRISFFAAKQELYNRIIALAVSLNVPEKGIEYAERAKSRAFVDILGSESLKLKNRKQDRALRTAVRHRVEIDVLLSGKNIGASQLNHLINRTKRAIQVKGKKEGAVSELELSSLSTVQTLTADEIKRLADPGVALLEYFTMKDRLIVFLVQNGSITATPVAVSEQDLLTAVNGWRAGIASNQDSHTYGRHLYNLLIGPVRQKLAAQQIIIVPHGPLHYIPFQALYDGNRYLIERYALSYAPSATVLNFTEQKQSSGNRKALIIGNPTADLAFAENEALNIAGLIPESLLLLGEKGTETAVKNQASNYEIIHLATHGFYDESNPLNSFIRLKGDDENNGSLLMSELFSLTWQASLVTLSACESGLSKYKSGDELIGLQRGLIFAGTRSIVSSLWSVDDAATGMLMTAFYKNLTSMPKNRALQKAQLETMQAFKNPFYWAAFNLTGARL